MNYRKFKFTAAIALLLCGTCVVVGQNGGPVQNPLVILRREPVRELSVIGMRRVNLIVDDYTPDGERLTKKLPHVEIELYVGEPEFNSQLMDIVQIGDTVMLVSRWSWHPREEGHYAFVVIPKELFDELIDGSEIHYAKGVPPPREELRKLYREGKVKPYGVRIGKFDKFMIEREGTLERRADEIPKDF